MLSDKRYLEAIKDPELKESLPWQQLSAFLGLKTWVTKTMQACLLAKPQATTCIPEEPLNTYNNVSTKEEQELPFYLANGRDGGALRPGGILELVL